MPLDPFTYAYAVGGKDGVPYPYDVKTADKVIEIMKEIVENGASLALYNQNQEIEPLLREYLRSEYDEEESEKKLKEAKKIFLGEDNGKNKNGW